MNDRVTAERIRMKVNTGYAYNYYIGGKAAVNTADNKTFDKNMAKAGNMPVITFDEDGAEENVAADKSKDMLTNLLMNSKRLSSMKMK